VSLTQITHFLSVITTSSLSYYVATALLPALKYVEQFVLMIGSNVLRGWTGRKMHRHTHGTDTNI